jgi:putative transposase
MDIFGDDTDREMFLACFETAVCGNDIAVHVITLMTNHYHAIVTPPSEGALPNAMLRLGRLYVPYFNRKYDRTGTLFGGRHGAISIGDEFYFWNCFRYVELNPVRARLIRDPADYRWSSYRVHGCGDSWDWLTAHDLYTGLGTTVAERQAAYRALCDQPLTEADLIRQRCARQDRPATLRPIIRSAAA